MRTPMPLGSVSCLFDDTRRRHEVVLRVFRTDTTFDGMTALDKFFLLQVQHLVIGYTDLFFYQIHAHHFFGDGMLHLKRVFISRK